MTNRNDLFDDEPEQPKPARAPRDAGRAATAPGSDEPPGDSGSGGPLNANVSRRGFLGGAAGIAAGAAIAGGVVGAGAAVGLGALDDGDDSGGGAGSARTESGGTMSLGAPNGEYVSEALINLNVNGRDEWVKVASHESLAEVLRRTLHLTGTKIGCDRSECSACTVIVDGVAKNSCSLLAIREDGHKISTIEGQIGPDGELSPVQQAFLDKMGLQCGFCTPGQIMQATALLAHNQKPDEAAIRHAMSGNLCKCAAYPNILAAIQQAAGKGTV
jgi:aerobic-type carbon monoxide dehydrogenase small subunit (CoxS/CutS family)